MQAPSEPTFTLVMQPGGTTASSWNQTRAIAIGIALIVIATTCYLSNLAWFTSNSPGFLGVGLLGGALIFAAGVTMMVSGFRATQSFIMASLVLSIICMLMDLVFVMVWALQMSETWAFLEMDVDPRSMGAAYILVGLVCFGLLLTSAIMGCINLCGKKTTTTTATYVPLKSLPN